MERRGSIPGMRLKTGVRVGRPSLKYGAYIYQPGEVSGICRSAAEALKRQAFRLG